MLALANSYNVRVLSDDSSCLTCSAVLYSDTQNFDALNAWTLDFTDSECIKHVFITCCCY